MQRVVRALVWHHLRDLIDKPKALQRALDAITSHAIELNRLAGVLACQITADRQEQENLRAEIDDLEPRTDWNRLNTPEAAVIPFRHLVDHKTADGVPIRDGLTIYRRAWGDDGEVEPVTLKLDGRIHEIDYILWRCHAVVGLRDTRYDNLDGLGPLTEWYGRKETVYKLQYMELLLERDRLNLKLKELETKLG